MKLSKNLMLYGLAVVFALTSCTLQERAHLAESKHECTRVKHKGHSGKYKNCSFCSPKADDQQSKKIIDVSQTPQQTGLEITKINPLEAHDNVEIITYADISQQVLPNPNSFLVDNTARAVSDTISLRSTIGYAIKQVPKLVLADSEQPRTQGLALTGFIVSVVGLFVAGIPLGILAIVFSSVGMARINKNPEKWNGKGFAIAGLVIGIVDVVAALILLALFL